MRAAEPGWNMSAEAATITQGSRTADEHILVLKGEGIMPLVWPPERMYLCTVCRDYSWSMLVFMKVAYDTVIRSWRWVRLEDRVECLLGQEP